MLSLARTHAAECLDAAFEAAKKRWDAAHTPVPFKANDQVMLSSAHFGILGTKKLQQPWLGPFLVIELVGPNALRLQLTAPWTRRHSVFPVSLCKLYKAAEQSSFPERPPRETQRPEALDEDGYPVYEVEAVLDSRLNKVGRGQAAKEYLVKWKNFDHSENTWEPSENLAKSPDILRAFHAQRRAEGRTHA